MGAPTGIRNPKKKYIFDERYFKTIDTEIKAYLLGFIASDGSINKSGFNIYVHEKDSDVLYRLKDKICADIPIKPNKNNLKGFSVNSILIRDDICRHLNISPGKKDSIVSIPKSIPEELIIHFIRGYFDGDGSVNQINTSSNEWPSPKCSIASTSNVIRRQIREYLNIPCCDDGKEKLEWWSNNALDLMGRLYNNSTIRMSRKYNLYLDWSMWVPGLLGHYGKTPLFKYVKTDKSAIPPSKQRASDTGYDVTLIKKIKETDSLVWYDTCVKIQPIYGWYFDMVPRSSMPKTGYILANSIGVIDRTYIGSLIACLHKIDKNAPDLELPAKILQLIPRPIINAQLVEGKIDDTERGEDGFGSTGR